MKTILAIDDDIEIRTLFSNYLSKKYNLILTDTAEKGFEIALKIIPDIIILDLELPGVNGYEFCSQFRNNTSLNETPIVIISSKKGANAHTMAYKLGADNYLEKPFDSGELKALIESILRRQKSTTKKNLSNIQIDFETHIASIDSQIIDMTPKEFKILAYLIGHPGEVISRERLLNVIWGDAHVTDRVIDNHITSIRRKMEKGNIKIESIYSEGYRLTVND